MPAAAVLVDLGILLALVVLIGLRFGYSYTLGRVLLMTAALLNTVSIPTPFGHIRLLGFAADAIVKADHAIMNGLGRGISDLQAAWNEALSYTAKAVHWIGHEIGALAHDAAQAVEGLHVQQVTNVYRKVNPRLAFRVGALAAAIATLRHQLVREAWRVAHLAQAKAVAVQHAIAVPDVGALPRAIPRVGHLEREIAAGLARLRDYARRFGPAAAVATVAFALARLGAGWVRCSKVRRVGRQLCGMNDDLLGALLMDATLIVGTVSLVELAEYMVSVTEELQKGILLGFRETRGLV